MSRTRGSTPRVELAETGDRGFDGQVCGKPDKDEPKGSQGPMAPTDAPPKRPRRWKRWFAVGALLLAGTTTSLPWLASTAPVRLCAVAAANGRLAPSRV